MEGENALYLRDCYLREFEATIASFSGGKYIVLDRTAFYPNSGGQPNDTGTMTRLSDGKVFRVAHVCKAAGNISHEIENPEAENFTAGEKVKCRIDWDRRYALMRCHTAAHVLSEVIHRETGARITGNQLDTGRGRIDFDLEQFSRDAIDSYAGKANSIIAQGLAVKKYFLPREDALKNPGMVSLRDVMPPEISVWRIVQIGEPAFDVKACGGCHVDNTDEIGRIEIIKTENKGRSNRRVYFELKQ